MSLFSTLYIGVSGMASNGAGIEVAGDNIANVNTVGFKRTRANFGDVMPPMMASARSFRNLLLIACGEGELGTCLAASYAFAYLVGGQIPHRDPDLSIGALSMGLQTTKQDKF